MHDDRSDDHVTVSSYVCDNCSARADGNALIDDRGHVAFCDRCPDWRDRLREFEMTVV